MAWKRELGLLILTAILGLASLISPVLLFGTPNLEAKYFLPLIPASLSYIKHPIIWMMLLIAGFVPGLLARSSSFLIGFATVASLFLWSVADAFVAYSIDNVERHNLIPFEWIFYSICALPGILGAFLAKAVRRTEWFGTRA